MAAELTVPVPSPACVTVEMPVARTRRPKANIRKRKNIPIKSEKTHKELQKPLERKTAPESFALRGLGLQICFIIFLSSQKSLCNMLRCLRTHLGAAADFCMNNSTKARYFTAKPFFWRNSRTNGRRSRLRMPEMPLIQVSSRGLRLREAKYSRMRAS